MHFDFTPSVALPALAALIAIGIGWRTWTTRTLPGSLPFVIVTAIAFVWSTCNALELTAVGLESKLLWNDLQYVAIVSMPTAWLVMVLDYTGHRSWLTPRRLLVLAAIPLVTLILAWTNSFHHLMRSQAWLDVGSSYPVVGRTFGLWFWIHALYSYAVAVAAVVLMVDTIRRAPSHCRSQPTVLLAGFLIPLIWNMVYVLAPGTLPTHDFTSAVFAVAGVLVAWGLLRLKLFGLVPIAWHTLFENMTDGLLVLDYKDRVVDFNESARRLIDLPRAQIVARPLSETWNGWSQLAAAYAAGADQARIALGQDDERMEYEVEISRLKDRNRVVGRLLLVRDVTQRTLMEESLRRQALTDSLTGLPNRTLFMAKLDDAIRQVRRNEDLLFAVVVLDLDRFKSVNDSAGHLAGDVLLQEVAAKLRRCVRDADVVGRMGGDEFMILLHGIAGARDVIPVVERIQDDLRVPVYFRRHELTSSASVGVVIWDEAYGDSEDLLKAADTAMYQAKEAGRSCYRIFDEKMHQAVQRTLRAEADLLSAVKNRDFSIAYQPVIELQNGTISSLEALIRWRHQRRGTVLPKEFIAMAEDSGLIVPLGRVMLEEVCSQLSRWRAPGSPAANLPISLNLSPRQLTEIDFMDSLRTCMTDWRISSDSLILEVTEAALIRDPVRSKQVMLDLRDMGIRLCLDDFGTGWSSLRHLTAFPVQELKIDRSFISKIAQDNTEFEIVRSITALAHTLGLSVTGEGVERAEQWRLLGSLGCDRAQGYFVGRPMAAEALAAYLDELSGRDRGEPGLRQKLEVPVRYPAPSWLAGLPASRGVAGAAGSAGPGGVGGMPRSGWA